MDQVEKRGDDEIEVAIKEGYLKTYSHFRKGNLVVSNAGDCRAVVSRNGVAEALTSDIVPHERTRRHRIESLGGYVECINGVSRILGSLAVSRSIGDQYLKQWVTAEPETRTLRLNPELEFLILASDGLWDKPDNQEMAEVTY
ncbi:protein phosphatase [Lithospermum erythrorhizon]|uniref:Protein phosphatase n=1 Tax=Lithospermum erythrorhizon TaxID=34254 RepID=A0AAV3QEY3_LITER